MKFNSHKQIINLVIVVVPITVVLCTLFVRPRFEVNSFDDCVAKKDSMMMLTYPGQCITKDGKKFIQPVDTGLMPEPIPSELPTGNNEMPGEAMRNYEDCIEQEDSVILESYPEQCVYSDGETVMNDSVTLDYPEPEDNFDDIFTCPATGWVDCMPFVTEDQEINTMMRAECTPEFEEWAYENCPNFEGIAY